MPLEKNLARFEMKRLPAKVFRQARTLVEGTFVTARENVLVFGLWVAVESVPLWETTRYARAFSLAQTPFTLC